MIVENKIKTIQEANELAIEFLGLLEKHSKESAKDSSRNDDPAEPIYFGAHLAGNLLSRICLLTVKYAQIYSIEGLSIPEILEWIVTIAKEHLEANRGK